MADKKLLKVLVIHGYRQSAKLSREKTGSLRKGLKKYLDLVYITAPNKIPPIIPEEHQDGGGEVKEPEEQYGWWFSNKKENGDNAFSAQENSQVEYGHQESIDLVEKVLEEQGPFDGILAFSQGATFAAHICALREKPDSKIKFNFAILCAGFKSRSTQHEIYYQDQITCPTLHVYGDTDKVIPKEMSIDLQTIFTNSTVLNHSGGHYLPATSAERKVYQSFLDQFR
ncbi:esterase OVCA2-like [Clytia hemisphaerica]|uniref:esterase OVCA2-like n=1 Tax=Clytia hemisphaerica TaxID=252671 RepID=UPI0034D4317D